ncbi:CarD family transcriptional regulator [Cohnella silvisoli]|uniref:CarD family transcriptional regulator n=1 Tax=Cohnella silvisoli TaxID=2873699 RepID=A0ABV1KZ70_9BACL|nr:CarD family transcriptional regulator [Cohnella silvisoli]MCD9024680.1 hypothetical protein [Cohnella silvisoli]
MFQKCDFVIYGAVGVCEIKSIDYMGFGRGIEKKLYYTLSAVFDSLLIYTPVDTQTFLRELISYEKASELLTNIEKIKTKSFGGQTQNSIIEAYEATIKSYDCDKLLQMIKSLYLNNQSRKKKNAIDCRYIQRAEELLFSELAVVLRRSREELKQFVETEFMKSLALAF